MNHLNLDLENLEKECWQILDEKGLRMSSEDTGEHYLLPSELHSPIIFELPQLFELGMPRERIALLLTARMEKEGIEPKGVDALVATSRSISLANTMQHLHVFDRHVRAIRLEEDNQGLYAMRRSSLTPNTRILVVLDAVVTFKTFKKIVAALNKACTPEGAYILGLAAFLDRTLPSCQPFNSFAPTMRYACGIHLDLPVYDPNSTAGCPDCINGIKLVPI